MNEQPSYAAPSFQPLQPIPPEIPKQKNNSVLFGFIIIVVAILSAAGGYLFLPQLIEKTASQSPENTVVLEPTAKPIVANVAYAAEFAVYKEVPVLATPQVTPYTIEAAFKNVTNVKDFSLSGEAKKLLEKNSFVVSPSYTNEFFSIYEENRYNYIPNFVTTDSILHNYHLLFDNTLKKIEEEKLIPELKKLNALMLSTSLEQYNALIGTTWEAAAIRNVGFFSLGSILLDPNVTVPALVKETIEKEIALIEAHQGISPSPIMGIDEDYSQYVPRGHYDKSTSLKAYFKSMMWYGRLTFRLAEENEVKSALLITLALHDETAEKNWDKLYEPINFFVGKSDDITYYHFKDLLEKIYGQNATVQSLLQEDTKFSTFMASTKLLDPPQINSMPILNAALQPDRETAIKGFRFMGQRFTIDASIFQRLITREVGPKGGDCSQAPFTEGRMLPSGLDIPSAMGSSEALQILKDAGETLYACYPENMSKVQNFIYKQKTEIWTQNLYWGWLYSLLPLTTEKTEGYPSFMQNLAWTRKELNTYLGSWTELKHDTILYAKQVYAELGGETDIKEKDDRGYVEPNPYVYARLAGLLQMTAAGLDERSLLSNQTKDNLSKMEQLALSLKTIAEKELNNQTITNDEYELIRSYGGQLEHIWLEVNKEDMGDGNADIFLSQNPASLIADIATDPNGSVLEEATGHIAEIFVIVPVEGKLKIAKGGVYSYYEFPWPMSDRLTDSKWREMLDSEKKPELPSWTDAFIASK